MAGSNAAELIGSQGYRRDVSALYFVQLLNVHPPRARGKNLTSGLRLPMLDDLEAELRYSESACTQPQAPGPS